MNNRNMFKPAAIGGIALGVLSAIPGVSCGCCIWIIGGGILAAYLFIKESPAMVTLGQGVLLGLFAGIVGTVVFALFQIPMLLISPESSVEMVKQVQSLMDQWPGFPPESREEFSKLAAREGFIYILYISSIFVQFFTNCLLAMLGGALGVAIFEKRKAAASDQGPRSEEPPSYLPPPPAPGE